MIVDAPVALGDAVVAPRPVASMSISETAGLEHVISKIEASVLGGSSADLTAELARISCHFDECEMATEGRMLLLERCLHAVAVTSGGHSPKFRAVCHPYAMEMISHDPPAVTVDLLEGQFFVFFNYVRWGASGMGPTNVERRESVEILLRLWDRTEASFQASRRSWEEIEKRFGQQHTEFEDIVAGKRFLVPLGGPMAEIIAEQDDFVYGCDPSNIKDPEARKAYEDLLAAERQRIRQFGDARGLYNIMWGYESSSRRLLQEAYGDDFMKTNEFSDVVLRTIDDKDRARRILDYLGAEP